jgi:hypothetical protein
MEPCSLSMLHCTRSYKAVKHSGVAPYLGFVSAPPIWTRYSAMCPILRVPQGQVAGTGPLVRRLASMRIRMSLQHCCIRELTPGWTRDLVMDWSGPDSDPADQEEHTSAGMSTWQSMISTVQPWRNDTGLGSHTASVACMSPTEHMWVC